MSRNKVDDGLNEIDARAIAAAEADLQRLLSVEPSVEFAAKVRERIAAERSDAPRWFTAWRLTLAAASLAVVGLLIAFAVRRTPSEVPSPAPSIVKREPAPVQPVRPEPDSGSRGASREERITNREGREANREVREARTEERVARNEPEVLVPPDQRIAIARALALSQTGALDERMFPADQPQAVAGNDAPSVPPIVVEDVVVPPITVPGDAVEKDSGRTDSKSY
jgi:hypothetical protein